MSWEREGARERPPIEIVFGDLGRPSKDPRYVRQCVVDRRDKVGGQGHPRRRRQGVRYKGALHPEQIDDMRLMLSRARDGSLAAIAPASAAATSATAPTAKAARPIPLRLLLCVESALPRCTGVHGRGPTRPPLSFKGCLPLWIGSIPR